MKILLRVALVGLAISFALPTLAQQTKPNPQIVQQYAELGKKLDEAYNTNDAAALAACFTRDAVLIEDRGPIYGREAIEKHYAEVFQKIHFSNAVTTTDQDSPHIIGAAGDEVWGIGGWSNTIKGEGWGPIDRKGYWGSISVLEDGVLKDRMQIWNVAPKPALLRLRLPQAASSC